VDSSLPVLVSRLPDRHALALLVRAALRNEVAQVALDAGPQRAEAHTLDLHVSGQPPLALLAEPAGNPLNGAFPLRLRPLYRAQAAQLYALLASENVPLDGPPPDTSPVPKTIAEPAPAQKPISSGVGASSSQRIIRAAASSDSSPRPLPARRADGDPRRTAPSATWNSLTGSTNDVRDVRRTTQSQARPVPAPQPPVPAPPPRPASAPDTQANADDPSLSVSVVFDPDDIPAEVKAAAAKSVLGSSPMEAAPATDESPSFAAAPVAPVPPPPSPAEKDEPSLSVSVVFEPDALPAALLAGVPSPLGDDNSPMTVVDMGEESPQTVADGSSNDSLSIDVDHSDEILVDTGSEPAVDTPIDTPDDEDVPLADNADDNASFFDDALANFPSAMPLTDSEEIAAAPQEEGDSVLAAIDSIEMVSRTDDVASLADFPDIDNLPESEPAPNTDTQGGFDSTAAQFDPNATQYPTDSELQLIDPPGLGEGSAVAKVPVPPPDDDDDDDATLIRLPTKRGPPPKPAEPVVRPASRDKSEHTPTKETEIAPQGKPIDPQETQLPPASERQSNPGRQSAPGRPSAKSIADSEADTSAFKKPPVAPPPAQAPPAAPSSDPNDPNDPAIGRRVAEGKYVIDQLIGSGAAGAVYRATHRELRRTVAIKLLHPHYQQDPHFMTSFRGEALAASQLDHPNVMRVLDFGQEPDGLVYIVMEYLSGRTLQQRLDEERRLPTEKAVEVMIQVCAALSVAHDHGIIHRDIKPDNIMLVPSRNDEGATFELVKVCDFGIAALQNPRAEDADLSANEHVIAGTPEYMSPEQARGAPVDARADVYACGICLYELVTGRPPFLGNNPAEILIKQLDETPAPPGQIVKGLDPIIEEIILRAIQKDPKKRHQSAREMRVELKELIDPGDREEDDEDELSIVENVAMLDDPASGFPGFFIAFSSAVLRFGRFERGHNESAQAMKELQKQIRVSLRGRSELTFARRDSGKTPGFVVMSGTAEIVDLKRLLGSQLMGSFGEPFTNELVKKGIAALTLREGIPDVELHYMVEMLLGPFAHEDLRKELLSKPLRHVSVLFVTDVVGRDRKLSWKVGLCAARLARDLRALCNIRGISLKKMRETRDELIGGVARLLTRGDEVRQFIFNADLIDEAVANLRGFSSFNVAPLIVDRILHESCAEAAMSLLQDLDASTPGDQERLRPFLHMFAQRLVTERSPKSDAAVAEFYRRKIIHEDEMPRDLKEQIRAASLADALMRDPQQFLRQLEAIQDVTAYDHELSILETAMSTLARRAEAVPLIAVMQKLAMHAKTPGPREKPALRTMKWMIDAQRLAPIANVVLTSQVQQQRDAGRQLLIIAGSVGASALYAARETATEAPARQLFVQVMRDLGAAGCTLMSQVLPRLELSGDNEIALVEDMLHAMPDRADAALGEAVSKFLSHPTLRPLALTALVPLWGERAKKPLVDALEYADEPARIIALAELRRLHAIDEYVYAVIERFLTMKGSAGEELRIAAAAALADAATPVRTRAVQMLTKSVEGKRGLVALIRGTDAHEETAAVLEAMARSLLALDRNEGMKALKGRVSRSEGATKQRLQALLQQSG
jgi:serine/threonine-protein kinase